MSNIDRQTLLSDAAPMAGSQFQSFQPMDMESQQPEPQPSILKQSSHPIALVFHFVFRIGALVVYLLANFFTSSFVFTFVIAMLLLACDFWTVKNVTGRLLVGLRWWNEVQEDGTNVWVFESRDQTRVPNAVDSRMFWYSLYATPVVWFFLALIAIIRFNFQWLLIVGVAVVLNGANLVGYMKCDKDAKQKWSGLASGAFGGNSGILGMLGGNLIGRMFSRG
ncbi:Golgi apparatus membrane protein tvp23 [Basidiobolus meristosporus CBS 931.73]|uniref:Golgi apparatus membrane protein TVP23 n=1 Tax=Basidiobolus meristosporus CBS 931.73 TaxID=1314790 RepID=A0A1Y1YTP6_9FUNG|nr:Golgi apparatus membrane protein tvp23 [Basidiobolus meristosporus CBS 931.73]|eukprot:ORY01381.1 Golgi apparatus membrane protein tvp23 [Basidiobolus meristosporus CBS 931.73]